MAIDSKYYLHPSDEKALEALKNIPGFATLMKSFMKDWSERQAKLRSMSSFIRINENQLSKYYDMLPPICEKLGIDIPELYLMMDVRPNAYTTGETNPQIVLTSGLLDTMPEELIPTILAHECGHIACHHVLYRTVGSVLIGGAANSISRLPFGGLISLPLQMAFFYWMRCSEYSADRAAVICDGSSEKMIEVCMRLSGYDKNIANHLNKEEYLKQAKEYRELVSDSKWDKTLEFYMLSGTTHPFTAIRALESQEWEGSEMFHHIQDGTYSQYEPEKEVVKDEGSPIFPDIGEFLKKSLNLNPTPVEEENICPHCKTVNKKESKFCKKCGTSLVNKIHRCPKCDAKLDGDEEFCPYCREKLK